MSFPKSPINVYRMIKVIYLDLGPIVWDMQNKPHDKINFSE